ncbi:PTS sugar transporter subunit IIC [Phocoenobacter skyensis]|uniref:Permease IIC component n=1 Tax=Phocoenobacter skyensis TaxID=97481 RepID=A0A1H7WE50_9PAST|nr:PTS transporter subunit EIIC [Pasteurella skyensis]MDP8162164.1 PTS transporter subunit EIIC [Pasteurella skyensis]MDP8173023.1 PTS transporter subunit EIIC [Pasteurella skyensis]MDP8176790.1 PTS transporter subunit EIIC [Pasteurella skyensis]MDP8179452.1 PTS transporter subunit EIIC [Pasteurella skyensis]MDP8183694.1 PTS transporter subunit EIIC [Pasteurella skyensis]
MATLSERFIAFMNEKVAPTAKRMENQPHISAIRDGFIVVLPFLIVGSFIMILLIPPFDENTTNSFGQAWWSFAHWASDYGWRFFQMSFNAISLFTAASIAYNLAKAYKREPLPAAFLSVMAFLLVAAPVQNGQMDIKFFGGIGLFSAIFIAIYTVELTRLLEYLHIRIKLPKEVPTAVAESLNIVIPILAVLVTLYPFALYIEASTGSTIPQLIMDFMAPLIKVSDSLGAICLFVFATHLLWFLGINGSLVLMQLWTPFLLQNMAANLSALQAGEPLPFIVTNSFWDFYIVHGASGGVIALAFLLVFSKSAHLRSIGKIGLVPSFFSIGEPIVYGVPMVVNPMFFIPLIFAPMANAIIAYLILDFNLIHRVYLMAPWTTPAPIGAYLVSGGDIWAPVLSVALIVLDVIIYYPFFKVYERTCIEREKNLDADFLAKEKEVLEKAKATIQ